MLEEKAYDRTIANKYLGAEKKIKGGSPLETRIKSEAQLAKWTRQEKFHKEQDGIESLKELAGIKTQQAENTLKACNSILQINLCSPTKLDWASFYDDRLLPPFVFKEHPPRCEQVARDMGVPRKSFFSELLFPSIRKKRLALEEAAIAAFEEQTQIYNARKASAQTSHEAQRTVFLIEQSEFNRSIDQLQMDVEKGNPTAIASLVHITLAYLEIPDEIDVDFDIQYHALEKLVVISGILPGPHAVPRTIRYEYQGEENHITPVKMDKASFGNYYESILLQITLSVVHIIFTAIPERQIHTVAFNGLIGDGESCILTCKVSRDLFDSIELGRNAFNVSFQAMQGIMVTPLAGLTPVEPLVWPAGSIAADSIATKPDGHPQPSAYQPGDIKNAANSLLVDLLDKIEKDLSKQPGDKDVVH